MKNKMAMRDINEKIIDAISLYWKAE